MKTFFDKRLRPTGQTIRVREYATSDGSKRHYSLLLREYDAKGDMIDGEIKVRLSASEVVRRIRIELGLSEGG